MANRKIKILKTYMQTRPIKQDTERDIQSPQKEYSFRFKVN